MQDVVKSMNKGADNHNMVRRESIHFIMQETSQDEVYKQKTIKILHNYLWATHLLRPVTEE